MIITLDQHRLQHHNLGCHWYIGMRLNKEHNHGIPENSQNFLIREFSSPNQAHSSFAAMVRSNRYQVVEQGDQHCRAIYIYQLRR